jgi:hypothetical protein
VVEDVQQEEAEEALGIKIQEVLPGLLRETT